MKPNVDVVDLIAGQELPTQLDPAITDYIVLWKLGELLGRKIPLETAGNLIASQIGTAINRPTRVYQPGVDMPDGAELILEDDPGSPNFGYPIGISDPYLDGLDYDLFKRSLELMIKGSEWQNSVVGGGFILTDGSIMEDGQVFSALFKPEIASVISTPDAVARFMDASGVYVVSASMTLTAASHRKLIFVQGSPGNTVLDVLLDDTYPEGVLLCILTSTGAQFQCRIQSGLGFNFNNGVTSIPLGRQEHLYLVRLSGAWYVTSISDGYWRSGDIVMGMVPGNNKISANGQTLQRNEWPRLDGRLDDLEAALPGSILSSGAWASSDKTQWGRSATEIFVPKLGGLFPRFLDLGAGLDTDRGSSGNIAGSRQGWALFSHTHPISSDAADLMIGRKPGGPGGGFGLNTASSGWEKALTHSVLAPEGAGIQLSTTENRPVNAAYPALIYV